MKIRTIVKASLALSILATGVITSTAQTVNASEHEAKYENVTKDIFDLRDYSGESKALKNVIGYHYSKGGRHYLVIDKIESSQEYRYLVKILKDLKHAKIRD